MHINNKLRKGGEEMDDIVSFYKTLFPIENITIIGEDVYQIDDGTYSLEEVKSIITNYIREIVVDAVKLNIL